MTTNPNPASIVADADVLAADLLVGGVARNALDVVRSHSWIDLVASDALLSDTHQLVARLVDRSLANDHRDRLERERIAVSHPAADHPALASAYRGRAAQLLTFDDTLHTARAGLSLQPRVAVSIRSPDAFATLFDAESLYEVVVGGEYPGPDRDPRA